MPVSPGFKPHGGREQPVLGAGPAPDGRPGTGGNVLIITADQFRASSLSCADSPAVVQTPALDALAADGVRFARHYTQGTPCHPGRASLHTGMYMMNSRAVGNNTPIDSRFTNWALELRKLGYDPTLLGYSDHPNDPRTIQHRDPVFQTNDGGPLPGVTPYLPWHFMADKPQAWAAWLRSLGYDVPDSVWDAAPGPGTPTQISAGEAEDAEAVAAGYPRPAFYQAEHSDTAFLVGKSCEFVETVAGRQPWALHLSLLRPHPPWLAPEPYNAMYHPDELEPIGSRAAEPQQERDVHPYLSSIISPEPPDEASERRGKSVYYGLCSEVDAQLGRLFERLKEIGEWDKTLVVFTADHGEQLYEHYLTGKQGFFEASYHIPLIVRDPRPAAAQQRGAVLNAFTEHVDVMPTIVDWLGGAVPLQCDGQSLLPWTEGRADAAQGWREAAHWEYDWRDVSGGSEREDELGLTMHQCGLMVSRGERWKYVHFTNLPPLLYDLESDPHELCNLAEEPSMQPVLLDCAMRLLSFRMMHAGGRELTGKRLMRDGDGVVNMEERADRVWAGRDNLPRFARL